MKAITTKFYGPTNARGSRIIASDEDGNKVTVHYDHALNPCEMHALAARTLCKKMRWHGVLLQGSLKTGYVFVWFDGSNDITVLPEEKLIRAAEVMPHA